MPTYNRLHLLQKTLESLFRQDFVDYEVIVVSDGSTDGTAELLTRLAASGRITYLHLQNQGPSTARNLGIHMAGGTFIAFIDDANRIAESIPLARTYG